MHRLLQMLYAWHLTQALRALRIPMPWIFEEIEHEWFGTGHLNWSREDVEEAFNLATRLRGLNWVLGDRSRTSVSLQFPGIGRRGGFSEFLRVYWFGRRMTSIVGTPGGKDLIRRVI